MALPMKTAMAKKVMKAMKAKVMKKERFGEMAQPLLSNSCLDLAHVLGGRLAGRLTGWLACAFGRRLATAALVQSCVDRRP